jgi:hypothetical protein
LDFPWLGKCGVLFLLDLYIYFGFPLARLKWRILLKSVRLPLQIGRFAWANRRPPTWKPPPHVHKPIKRSTFGRLMQARIGHTHLGEYYRDFNIPEDISCPCGATIQTRTHILSECPIYEEQRHLLHDEEQNIIPTDLFGTKEGIEQFTKFLSKTNAFANRNHI